MHGKGPVESDKNLVNTVSGLGFQAFIQRITVYASAPNQVADDVPSQGTESIRKKCCETKVGALQELIYPVLLSRDVMNDALGLAYFRNSSFIRLRQLTKSDRFWQNGIREFFA